MATDTRKAEAADRLRVLVVKVRGRRQYGVQCDECGDLLETLSSRRAAGCLAMVHAADHRGELGQPIEPRQPAPSAAWRAQHAAYGLDG